MRRISVIGLGLMGGSLIQAIRKHRPDAYVLAYNRSRQALEMALSDGSLDEPVYDLDLSRLCQADLVVLGLPVPFCCDLLGELAPYGKQGRIFSDLGSVKQPIMRRAQACMRRNPDFIFVGGHPMAGSERAGYAAADAHLYEGCRYVLCPNDAEQRGVHEMTRFALSIGSRPLTLPPDVHDQSVAYISHLPHIVSAAASYTAARAPDADLLGLLAAGGFRDVTRIAGSSPWLWRGILLENREAVLSCIREYKGTLAAFESALEQADGPALEALFGTAKAYRDALYAPQAPNKQEK